MFWYARKKEHPDHDKYLAWFREYMTRRRLDGRECKPDKEQKSEYDRFRYLHSERWKTFKKKYKISKDEYLLLLEATGGKCPICNVELKLGGQHNNSVVVDHCHKTGDVRGLICQSCNQGIGRFEDDPNNLRRAAEYLERSRL